MSKYQRLGTMLRNISEHLDKASSDLLTKKHLLVTPKNLRVLQDVYPDSEKEDAEERATKDDKRVLYSVSAVYDANQKSWDRHPVARIEIKGGVATVYFKDSTPDQTFDPTLYDAFLVVAHKEP